MFSIRLLSRFPASYAASSLGPQEVRDLLRPYLDSSQLPLLLQLLHSAPAAWRDATTRTRTRTLLALVEPSDVHLLRVSLGAGGSWETDCG